MDYQSNNYEGMDSRYTGNRSLYCDLCMRRCRGVYHVIERGDTLYSLSKRYHVTVADLMRANPYVNVYNLRIGEELCIPVRPQPRMGEEMEQPQQGTMPNNMQPNNMQPNNMQPNNMQPNNMSSNNMRMNMGNEMVQQRERMSEPEQFVAEEEVQAESRSGMENQFSEDDTLKEVFEKTGLSMADFIEFLAKKMD